MSDIRYALRSGDKTSTSGVLAGTGRSVIHHGVLVGVEGDFATCPACKAGGPVMNDCLVPFNVLGKQLLVTGARVYCKCPVHPFVIHSRTDFSIEVSRGHHQAAAHIAPHASGSTDEQTLEYDELIVLKDEDGHPVVNQRYKITAEDGKIYEGVTDGAGETSRIHTKGPKKLIVELV